MFTRFFRGAPQPLSIVQRKTNKMQSFGGRHASDPWNTLVLYPRIIPQFDGSFDTLTIAPMGEKYILNTSCPLFAKMLRAERKLEHKEEQDITGLIEKDEKIIATLGIQVRGTYSGGSPTAYLKDDSLREQIGPDSSLFSMLTKNPVEDWKKIYNDTNEGPRIASIMEIVLVKNIKTGSMRQLLKMDGAFVNTTKSVGVTINTEGKFCPITYYTPGAHLRHHIKESMAQCSDGSQIQTISTLVNASASVLLHWISKLLGTQVSKSLRVHSNIADNGSHFKQVDVTQQLGMLFLKLSDAFTGTPFAMNTITLRRNKKGEVTHIMMHARQKPWPQSELLLTSESGDQKLEVYSTKVPHTETMKDLTVAKLITPIMSHSTEAYTVTSEGTLLPLKKEDPYYKLMLTENEVMRYGVTELVEFGATLGMTLSALGASSTDERASGTYIADKNGFFNLEDINRDIIRQDPASMEHILCGLITKLLATCIEKKYAGIKLEDHYHISELWKIATSQTSSYLDIERYIEKYHLTLNELVDCSDAKERIFKLLDLARLAHQENKQQRNNKEALSQVERKCIEDADFDDEQNAAQGITFGRS